MNKHLFRIIFSKARGMLVVVAESTRSRTKCRAGKGRSIKVGPPILAKPLTLWILLALGAPFALIDRAVAEIIVDSTAPAAQRPTLGTSANGTTRVDIQTPSAAGVSRNTYSRFDVEQRGVILNNARTAVNTRIGGFVDGNPNLGHGEAGIILNEVNAADPSRLNGFIEVAGQRAEVIVANPAGISCSGCGFINASRSTLTTGTPLIEGGRLEGFRVEGGTVSIGSGGLNDSDSDYTQLIARAVEVNASIQAQELRVTTGTNDVGRDAQPTTVNTPSPGSSAPAFALDVAQLGGMYAGKILLVGTENGVGVRNAGSIGAMTGSLSLSADGKLTNSGLISAATDGEIEVTGALDNSGSIYAAGDQTITAEQIDNSDIIAAGNDLSLTATDSISGTSDSILAAGVNGDLSLADSGSLSLNAAGTLTLHGQNLAAGRLQMQAAAIDMTDSTNLATDVDIRAQVGDIDADSAQITAVGQATLTTDNGDLLNGNGRILAANLNANINGTLDNRGGLMQASDTLSLTAVTLDNRTTNDDSQGLRATVIDIEAATLDNRSGFIGAVDSLQLEVEQQLDNAGGEITALNRAMLDDGGSGTLAINNANGQIQAGSDLQLQARALTGSGSLLSGGDLSLRLQQDHTHQGELRAEHDATLNISGELTNEGTLGAVNQLSIDAVDLDNLAEGEITAATALLNIDGALQNRGLIDGGLVRIEAQLLDNIGSGRLYGDHLATQVDQLQNRAESGSPATLAARDRLDLGLRTLTNSDGSLIFSAGDLAIGRELDSDNRATGQAELLDNRSASIEALGDIVIDVATLQNVDDYYQVTKTLLSSEAHTDYRPKNSATRYDSSLIQWGHTSKGATKIISPFNAEDFYVYNYTRSISEDRVSNQAPASILSGGNMQIDADTLINDQSKLLAGGTLVANAGTLQNDEINLQRYTQDNGTVYFTWVDSCGKDDHCRKTGSKTTYAPAQQIQTLSTLTGVVDQNQAITGSGTSLSAYAAQGTLINLSGIDGQQVQLGGDSVDGVVRSGGYLSLPNAGLFTTNSGDVSQPLIETDPRFTSYRSWLNAEYALGRLTTNPDITQRRLGDGFIEQRLVQQQISELTGRRYLPGFSNDEEQYRALLDAGVTFGSTFNLSPGIALTEAQMQQLTSDIVWLVEESVSLPDGTRANVLVPRVYALVQAGDLNGSGALLGGNNVDLNIDNRLSNSGRILAAETLLVDAADLTNRRGGIAARQLQLTTTGNLNNEGGLIQAEDTLSLRAGGDLNLTTLTRATENRVDGNEFEQESVDSVGTLLVTGEEGVLSARAEGDLNLTGAAVVNQGENGSTTLSAGNDLNLLDVHTRRRDALVWDSRNYLKEENSQSIGTLLSGEGSATLVAGRDINTRAAEIDLNGDLQAVAGRNINIDAGENSTSQDEHHYITSSGLLSSKTSVSQYRRASTTAQAGNIQADNATLVAGNDLDVTGSNLIADNDLNLRAGNDINVQAAENSHLTESFSSKTRSGLMSGGDFGIFAGTRLQSKQIDETRTSLSVSTLGSLDGSVSLDADNDVNVTASDLLARSGDIRLAGDNVSLDSGYDHLARDEVQRFEQTGFTLAISGGVVSTVQQIQRAAESAKDSDNTKLQALQAWRSGRLAGDLMGQVDSLQYLGDDFSDPTTANTATDDEGNAQSSGVNLSLSFGASRSEQTRSLRDDRALGTSLIADGDITIQARGDSAREGSGDITSVGSLIEGRNINLDAADDIRLLSAENTHTDDSDSKSSSAGIGISIGSDGLQLYVEGSLARGEINQSNDRYLETQLNADQSVSLTSGNDTRLEGAQVNADRILVDIGGDLSIISQQDEEHYSNEQQSLGVKVGVGIGPSTPVNLSLNYSELDAKSEYIAVQEQSGLFAGAGGFDVQVGGNTDLQGGAIVSDSDPANNRLSTETLTYNALNNHAEYDIDSMSIGISTTLSGNMQNLAQGLGGGFGSDSGDARNTTYAAISDGNIEIRANPGQSLDDLKRSKEDAHRVLERIFSDDKVDAVQEQVELTQVFAEEAYLQVGNLYRDLDNAEAMLAAAERQGDPELIALWQDRVAAEQAKLPLDKSLAHALVGGMTAVLGGGDFTQGALAAGVNEAVAEQLKEQIGESGTLNNLAHVLIGRAVGGTPGGIIAGTADLNNRQLHPTEIDLIEANAEAFAERIGITDTDLATAILTEVALNSVDRDWSTTADNIGIGEDTLAYAQSFLRELAASTTANNPDGIDGAWFTATDKAFNDSLINAERLFPQSEDLDTFGFDAAEGINQRRDYTDFYERFAAVKDPVAAKQSTLDYAKAALADKGVNLADALTSKETWIAAYDGAVEILRDDNPFLAFSDSQLKSLQGDHALSDALKAVETQAVIYELQGDEETANRLRGQATAEILVAELGAATNATGVGVSTKAGSVLTGKLNDLAGAAKQKLASDISSKIDELAMSALIDSGGIIDKTGTPLLDLRVLTREQKGILGDLFGAETVKRIVPEGQKLARVPGVGETGIDDLYKVNRADVDYVVIEYKFVGTDSKTGAQSLGRTKDGRQGSESWTLGSGRIEKAVGEKNATAIYKAIDNNRVETWVVTTRADGATEIQVLDALGVAKEIDTSNILTSTVNLTGAAP